MTAIYLYMIHIIIMQSRDFQIQSQNLNFHSKFIQESFYCISYMIIFYLYLYIVRRCNFIPITQQTSTLFTVFVSTSFVNFEIACDLQFKRTSHHVATSIFVLNCVLEGPRHLGPTGTKPGASKSLLYLGLQVQLTWYICCVIYLSLLGLNLTVCSKQISLCRNFLHQSLLLDQLNFITSILIFSQTQIRGLMIVVSQTFIFTFR